MFNRLQRRLNLTVSRDGVIRRRDFLRNAAAAGLAAGSLGWRDLVAAEADALRSRGMACILLFMRGGPSQFETFAPKPGHANGGATQAISTSVAGIDVAETLPHVAQVMDRLAVIRSMTTKEGNHQRAAFLMHTGYAPTASVRYPTLGATAAQQIADAACELPAFVRIGGRGQEGGGGGGFLGVEFDAFDVQSAGARPANTSIATSADRFERRLELLGQLDAAGYGVENAIETANHRKLYEQAARMIASEQMAAFDLEGESDATRDAYGRTEFGASCLLARRLVESGATFVEINSNGWDTHDDNFDRTKTLCGQVDQPFAQLVADLAQRGMLERTLVLWMGEFGRTPRVNARGGRDHFPRAFSLAMAGGGVRGGQVIGATDAGGETVSDRPVTVQDLFQSICRILAIDAAKENMSPIGRPIKVVDGGNVVTELFG